MLVHGRPLILTNFVIQFTLHIFQDFTVKFGIKLNYIRTAHLQTNSLNERINTAIKSTIAILQAEGHDFFNTFLLH